MQLNSPPTYLGSYRALVTSVTDPTLTGRIRTQCPQISGTAELNWALPLNPLDPIPAVGTVCWIFFNGGDLTKPVYAANGSYTTAPVSGIATGTVQTQSLTTSSSPDVALVAIVSGAIGVGTGNTTAPHVSFKDGNGASAVDVFLSGTVIKRDLATNRHIWHTPSPLGTGWAIGPNSGTVQPLQYRFDAFDNLVLMGAVHTTSATPAVTLFTLPSVGGYRPAITQRKGIVSNASSTITQRMVEINSNGGVTFTPALAATATDVYFDAIVPLGNIA